MVDSQHTTRLGIQSVSGSISRCSSAARGDGKLSFHCLCSANSTLSPAADQSLQDLSVPLIILPPKYTLGSRQQHHGTASVAGQLLASCFFCQFSTFLMRTNQLRATLNTRRSCVSAWRRLARRQLHTHSVWSVSHDICRHEGKAKIDTSLGL